MGKVESVYSHIFSAVGNDSYTINNHKDVSLLHCKISHETLNHYLEKLKLKGLFSTSQLTRPHHFWWGPNKFLPKDQQEIPWSIF